MDHGGIALKELMPLAEKIGAALKARQQTVAVAESSAGGLISAALLAVPGASAYFIGGGVFYTRQSILMMRDTRESMFKGLRGATEPWALLLAQTLRARCGADWGLGESGAAGPAGNRYGDPPGHAACAVTGIFERSIVLDTGSNDRIANMVAFSSAALKLLAECLEKP
ncbi:MAG TPA: CinA family protein [Burkholderiales bacterium]|nr:CinA family protein [Burkholderiales bacterium]